MLKDFQLFAFYSLHTSLCKVISRKSLWTMQLSGMISSRVAINLAMGVLMFLKGERHFTAALKEGVRDYKYSLW